ncbi:tyrosinase family protein [Mesorhizobium waimense]|uniref:tyrosinase family protein n=1 Tax=Mesorhizobium waimense TaxID=1300307 RepID=UPI001ABEEF13|nr:tyrosinase family protein [Mesorhizobium waimense]
MAIRRDATTLGAGWNKTLVNYALAVRALDQLPFDDRNSWRFLGAMHGFDAQLWESVGLLSDHEKIPADINGDYRNQCQHASWYFVAWHRGYVGTFEAIVAAKVKELTGDDWALPYWNYLDSTNAGARKLPQAFPGRHYARRYGKPAEILSRDSDARRRHDRDQAGVARQVRPRFDGRR